MKPVAPTWALRLLTLLLAAGSLTPGHAALDDILGGTQPSGCGVTMSCTPADTGGDGVPTSQLQCINNVAGTPCGTDSGPASQPSSTGQNVGAGNPLSLLSGNKYQKEIDLPALPGVLGLEIVRHYNSQRSRTGSGIIGRGWKLSYDTELYATRTKLQIVQADGTRVVFSRSADDPSLCASADPARGKLVIARKPRGEEYVWVWPDGRKLYFDQGGKLVQILAPTGEFVTLQRDPGGNLVKVTDPQGRSLVLSYVDRQTPGFHGVAHIDSPTGRFSYAYGSTPPDPGAPEAALAASNLVKVILPTDYDPTEKPHPFANRGSSTSTLAREYHYEDPRFPTLLTGITVSGAGSDEQTLHQRIGTYVYDARARAVRSVRGPLPPEGERGPEDVSLDFSRPDQTVLSNSLGEQTVYLTALIGSERRILEARGPGCAACGPTNLRYRYDTQGRLTATTTLNERGRPRISVQTRFDAASRPLRVTRLDLSGAKPRLIEWVRYEYAPAPVAATPTRSSADPDTLTLPAPHPILVARPSVVPGAEHQLHLAYNEAGQLRSVTETGFSPALPDYFQATPDTLHAIEVRPTPLSRTTTYTYARINGRSVLAETDGPLPNGPQGSPADSDVTRLEWDALGRYPVAITVPGGAASDLTHDGASGQLTRIQDRQGFATDLHYNARQQLTRVQHSGPGWIRPTTLSFLYDALGRRTEHGQGDSADDSYTPSLRQAFDAQGRMEWQAHALGIATQYGYDSESRLTEIRQSSASMLRIARYRYDPAGRIVEVSDNTGRRQLLMPEPVDVAPTVAAPSAPPSSTSAKRKADSNLAPKSGAQRPPLSPRRLVDDFGRLVLKRSPDSGQVHYHYDEADRLTAMRDARGNRARYEHDVQGRILRQRITDAGSGAKEETRWRYEGRRLVELVHPTQSERFDYDARGLRSARIVILHTAQGELTAITRYEHDERGDLVATTLPDGSRLHYERNAQGQVVALKRGTVQTAWLRWLDRDQPIAHDFERDLAGLRSYTAGNGIQTLHQRSREGILARVVHRQHTDRPSHLARHQAMPVRLGYTTRETIEQLLGVRSARAQDPEETTTGDRAHAADPTDTRPEVAPLPGALGLPDDPSALLDHRYVWDVRGNLLHSRQRAHQTDAQATRNSHAYDRQNRLVASVRWQDKNEALTEEAVWRYAYDPAQRRVLSQQGIKSQAELRAGTLRSAFQPRTHRRTDMEGTPARYSPSGQPEQLGKREYDWDARGRLVEVREHGATVARYGYDHRGLRNAKHTKDQTRYTVHDEARQPLVELDRNGRILRQYVWLADLPLAVIDTPQGAVPVPANQGAAARIATDLLHIVEGWFGSGASIVWLHGNHLGAPEVATDAHGQVLWRASYAPFGAATVQARDAFSLNLRLPGQYHDTETGLHYNRARYYDPDQGQYLSPDPLGTPDGPNPYAYVAFNPLAYVDPDGFILFAFDGTDNSWDLRELERLGGSRTNAARFWDLYDDGPRNYVSGVGTQHFEDGRTNYIGQTYQDILPNGLGPIPDRGGNFTGRERIERMWSYFIDEAEAAGDETVMDIDIVGFSRGAAQARDFANLLAAASVVQDGRRLVRYSAIDGASGQEVTRCQPVSLRFMGLFDTVLSTDLPWGSAYRLGIPEEFAFVAHAVALNEYRSQPYANDVFGYPFNAAFWNATRRPLPDDLHQGGFPLESIGASSHAPGQVRIERGFIGAHADIGGGYAEGENQLSFVALNWMVEQAKKAEVNMDTTGLDSIPVSSPILHDQSNALRIGDPRETPPVSREVRQGDMTFTETELLHAEDRQVRGAPSGTTQQNMGFTDFGSTDRSLTTAGTHDFIAYTERPVTGNPDDTWNALTGNRTGQVDISKYMEWLCGHDYFDPDSPQCPSGGTAP